MSLSQLCIPRHKSYYNEVRSNVCETIHVSHYGICCSVRNFVIPVETKSTFMYVKELWMSNRYTITSTKTHKRNIIINTDILCTKSNLYTQFVSNHTFCVTFLHVFVIKSIVLVTVELNFFNLVHYSNYITSLCLGLSKED